MVWDGKSVGEESALHADICNLGLGLKSQNKQALSYFYKSWMYTLLFVNTTTGFSENPFSSYLEYCCFET